MKYFNIPVFVPHLGCPFDCVFCNQRRITGTSGEDVDEKKVKEIIEEHLKQLPADECEIEIAFFGGSFTGIDKNLQERLLGAAYEYVGRHGIVGIRASTRPDYISREVMERMTKYGTTTLELGVQSMSPEVLSASCRGHTVEDVEKAVSLIREYPIKLGLQMMTGLPGDTDEKSLETADKLIALKPDFVRIYPTLVIKGTALEDMYKSGSYRPQTVYEAAELCHKLLQKFNAAGVKVIRVGLQNTDEISPDGSVVAGPYHGAFGELVESEIYFDKIKEKILPIRSENIVVRVNPHDVSKATGHKKCNIEKAEKLLGKKIKIKSDSSLNRGEITAEGR